ncbi:hypothetical protein EDB87DRAFT_1582138 [Lactarius vividus]|nr:hypothetical protein EDB87DRAFT_1582138 [Lactarius vividus]
MPAREEVETPAEHSLALFSEGHVARNEVNCALALVADPGAAADIHRFHLSTRRKQELFAWMRDLDIAWNDWLAEAEGIDLSLYQEDSMCTILTNQDRTIDASKRISTIWTVSPPCQSLCGREETPCLETPRSNAPHYTTKKCGTPSVCTVKGDTRHNCAPDLMSSVASIRCAATYQFITPSLGLLAQ